MDWNEFEMIALLIVITQGRPPPPMHSLHGMYVKETKITHDWKWFFTFDNFISCTLPVN